jgi:trk system potassium uptake protein TrkH
MFVLRTVGYSALLTAIIGALGVGVAWIDRDPVMATGSGLSLAASAILAAFCIGVGRAAPVKAAPPGVRSVLAAFILCLVTPVVFATPAFAVGESMGLAAGLFTAAANLTTTGAPDIGDPVALTGLYWRAALHIMGAAFAVAGGLLLYRFVDVRVVGLRKDLVSDPALVRQAVALGRFGASCVLVLAMAGALVLALMGHGPVESAAAAVAAATTGYLPGTSGVPVGGGAGWTLALLSLIGATSFVVLERLVRSGPGPASLKSVAPEVWIGIGTLLAAALIFMATGLGWERAALLAIGGLTTTGAGLETHNAAAPAAVLVVLALAAVGGSVGSTAGGLKLSRVLTFITGLRRELAAIREPMAAHENDQATIDGSLAAWGHLAALVSIIALTGIGLSLSGIEFSASVEAAAGAVTTVGPAMAAALGPDLSQLPDAAFLTLTVAMIAGRVEVVVLFAALFPRFWRG